MSCMLTGRRWLGRGGLLLSDADATLGVYLAHLGGDREQVNDCSDAEKPEREEPEESAPDLPHVEVLHSSYTDEGEEHDGVGDAGFFISHVLNCSAFCGAGSASGGNYGSN